MRADPRQDLFMMERLGDVIHAAGSKPRELILYAGHDRGKDHRNSFGALIGFQAPAGLKAIDARQEHIQHDQIWLIVAGQFQPQLTAQRHHDLKALLGQKLTHNRQVGGIVIDDQDRLARGNKRFTGRFFTCVHCAPQS
jgi:hypothetical protein